MVCVFRILEHQRKILIRFSYIIKCRYTIYNIALIKYIYIAYIGLKVKYVTVS